MVSSCGTTRASTRLYRHHPIAVTSSTDFADLPPHARRHIAGLVLIDRVASLREDIGDGSFHLIGRGLKRHFHHVRFRSGMGSGTTGNRRDGTGWPPCVAVSNSFGLTFLQPIDHVRIRLIDTGNGMVCQHQLESRRL